MLEPVRQYALEKLKGSGEEEQARERHAGCYEALARRGEPALRGPDQARWLDLLEQENDNMRTALSWTIGRKGNKDVGLRLAVALRRFWSVRGQLEEGRRWLQTAVASCPAPALSLRAKALCELGEMALEQGEYGPALSLFEESLALGRSLRNKTCVASALQGLAGATLWRGDHDRAALLCAESVTLRREAGDRQGLATSLNVSGLVEIQRGDHERALTLLKEGLAVAQEVGDVWAVAVYLDNLGWANLGRGDHERAARSFGESLQQHSELGEKWLAADCLDGLARVAFAQDDPVRAARLWGAAEALCEAIGATTAPLDQAAYARHLAAARTRLGEAAFLAAWAEGRVMELEEAVAEALSEDA
jgi:tetratricopeptide (TPR) repeat protein